MIGLVLWCIVLEVISKVSFCILQKFGGSAKVARELYGMLQPENADFVSEDEVRGRLDNVLKLYLKKKDDDKSG